MGSSENDTSNIRTQSAAVNIPPETLAPKPNIRTEAIAGITTFFTMSYIVVVNPSILSTPKAPAWLSAAC